MITYLLDQILNIDNFTFSKAAIFVPAVPLPPEMMAPAWPMRRPGGAVTPAMKETTGLASGPWGGILWKKKWWYDCTEGFESFYFLLGVKSHSSQMNLNINVAELANNRL